MAQEYTPLQPKAAQPRPNMFANWPQNGQGNWANMVNTARKATDEYVGNTLQGLGVSDPQKPQTPVTPPYEAGTVVLPPKNTNQGNGTIKVTDNGTIPGRTETQPYTGGSNNPQAALDYLGNLYTSPGEEERLHKASVANQRILAVGDALRHIGNIFNTVNYAPAQKFNNPVQEEYDRYQKGKAIRDAANARYYSYMQAKAAQDARIRQAEAQNQLRSELNAAQVQNYKDRAEEYARHNKEMEDLYKSKAETAAQNAQRNYEHKVETDKRRLDISQQRANKVGAGRSSRSRGGGSRTGGYKQTTTYTYDKNGKRTGSVVEKTPTGTYDQQKKPNPMGGGSNSGKKKNPMS